MKHSLLFISVALFLVGCKEDTTPSWLEIPAINLSTDEPLEGANTHNITDAWVYMDGEAIGVFELPARIPILDEGEHTFLIYAGIKNNGSSVSRIRYPFYERYETELNLVKGETISITPTVYYKSNTKFELIEDFEAPGMAFENNFNSLATMVFVNKSEEPEIVQYGYRCGAIYLDVADSLLYSLTTTYLNLPRNEDVFAEIDFKSDNSIRMGVIAQNSTDYNEHPPVFHMNPQDNWTKIYFELKEDVSWEVYATSYEIYFLSVLDPDKTTGTIYLDNIKILCYE